MRNLTLTFAISAIVISLSSCGDNRTDRALSGAGIGAGVGALGAAATGGSVAGGALLGAGAGAATGAATDKDDIDFGDPAWKK